MYYVSFLVDHDVAIMPVLDLQDVTDQGVGGHALDEVSTGLGGKIRKIITGELMEITGEFVRNGNNR